MRVLELVFTLEIHGAAGLRTAAGWVHRSAPPAPDADTPDVVHRTKTRRARRSACQIRGDVGSQITVTPAVSAAMTTSSSLANGAPKAIFSRNEPVEEVHILRHKARCASQLLLDRFCRRSMPVNQDRTLGGRAAGPESGAEWSILPEPTLADRPCAAFLHPGWIFNDTLRSAGLCCPGYTKVTLRSSMPP